MQETRNRSGGEEQDLTSLNQPLMPSLGVGATCTWVPLQTPVNCPPIPEVWEGTCADTPALLPPEGMLPFRPSMLDV